MELMAQSALHVRFIPPSAHHGAVGRQMMYRLIRQHGVNGAEDMEVIATTIDLARRRQSFTMGARAKSSASCFAHF